MVLDEAFDKADSEFTAMAMNIFKTFGFQMVIAKRLDLPRESDHEQKASVA